MPVPAGTRMDPQATRERLLRAAAEAFARSGGADLSVNDVVKTAGASKETLYRNFGSKEEMVAVLVARHSDETMRRFTQALQAAGPEPEERLAAYFDELELMVSGRNFFGCPILKTASHCAVTLATTGAARLHVNRHTQLLTSICGHLSVRKGSALADQLTVLVEGALAMAAATKSLLPVKAARSAALTLLETNR